MVVAFVQLFIIWGLIDFVLEAFHFGNFSWPYFVSGLILLASMMPFGIRQMWELRYRLHCQYDICDWIYIPVASISYVVSVVVCTILVT